MDSRHFGRRWTVSTLTLASLMVVFLLPGSASGDLPGQEYSVGFKGTVFTASWVTYTATDTAQEFWLNVADGQLRDAGEKGRGDPGQIVKFGGLYGGSGCESWNLAGAVRFDANLPFDTDTESLNVVVPVVAEHKVVTGGSEPCAWEDPPLVHEHFSGAVTVVLEPVEKCPKKGPKSGCNRSNTLSGTFTVVLDAAPTPFDGPDGQGQVEPWTSEDFQQSWRGDWSYNGTYRWTEPIIP